MVSGKRRTWLSVVIVLLVFLGIIIFFGFLASLFGLRSGFIERKQSGPEALKEVVIEDNDSTNSIAVIEVSGLIADFSIDGSGYTLVKYIEDQFDRAAMERDVRAVILRVNSPGGEVLAADRIYRCIGKFYEKTGKPVVASMSSLAASGGYYVSAPCQWIVANELTITGSIGVIMRGWNYHGLMNKVGIEPVVFKSGEYKDMMSGYRAPSEIDSKEREMIQDLVDQAFDKFKSVVVEGREEAFRANDQSGRELAGNWAEYADGRVLSGSEAFEHGFVDELGYFETAVKRTLELAEIKSADLVRFQKPVGLGDIIGLFLESRSSDIKINLGLNPEKIKSGHLYYLPLSYFE